MDDRQLLRQFVDTNSQEAFSVLTKRYLSLVYSVCRRELDDTETAEDVTQAVFLILARKAPALRRTVVLPLLNQSLAALKEGERECVLLRFFQEMSFAETGLSLGLTEEAARKRVGRALEKMRRFFGKSGVIIPSVALAALLSAHAAKAVPPTCQANIAHLTLVD